MSVSGSIFDLASRVAQEIKKLRTEFVSANGNQTVTGVKEVPVGSANSWIFNQPPQIAEGSQTYHPVRRDDPRLSDARTPLAHNHSAASITSGALDPLRLPPTLHAVSVVSTTGTGLFSIDVDSFPYHAGLDITMNHNSGIAAPTGGAYNRHAIEIVAFANGGTRTFTFANEILLMGNVSSRTITVPAGNCLVAEIVFLGPVLKWAARNALIVPPNAVAATRKNWSPNPAATNDLIGYSGTTAGAARITNATTLPRATAISMNAGDLTCPRVACTPGETLRFSTHLKAISATRTGFFQIHFRGTDNAWVDASPQANFSVGSGSVSRLDSGSVVVPAGSVDCYAFLNTSGASQVTGFLYERASTLSSYFDGGTSGAVWDGTAGSSTSTLTA